LALADGEGWTEVRVDRRAVIHPLQFPEVLGIDRHAASIESSLMQSGGFEELRQQGLRDLRLGRFEPAAAAFEAAESCASSPSEEALARIHRASVEVLGGTSSGLVHELPELILRGDGSLQRFLAAYYLAKFLAGQRRTGDAERYLKIAFESADDCDDPQYAAA